jgi:hypothetical protein
MIPSGKKNSSGQTFILRDPTTDDSYESALKNLKKN